MIYPDNQEAPIKKRKKTDSFDRIFWQVCPDLSPLPSPQSGSAAINAIGEGRSNHPDEIDATWKTQKHTQAPDISSKIFLYIDMKFLTYFL